VLFILYRINNTQGYDAYRGLMPMDQSVLASVALG
jgi:hypothetical protein